MVRQKGIDYRVLMGNQATFERFNGYSIPYTVVLDRSRTVRKQFFGRMTLEDLEEVIKSMPEAE
jgi:hypothetical protein